MRGAGQSVVCTNLAIALAHKLGPVVVVDTCLQNPSQHKLFGFEAPEVTLESFLAGQRSLEASALETVAKGVRLVCGFAAQHQLGTAAVDELVQQARGLDAKAVVFDCDRNLTAHELLLRADARVLVVTPGTNGIQAAYAVMHGAILELIQSLAGDEASQAALERAARSVPDGRIGKMVAGLASSEPALSERLEQALGNYELSLLGNLLASSQDSNEIHALGRLLQEVLAIRVATVGALRRSDRIEQSAADGAPFIRRWRKEQEERWLLKIAERLAGLKPRPVEPVAKVKAPPAARPPISRRPGADKRLLPSELQRYQRRHERYRARWPVVVEVGGVRARMVLTDVSAGGAALKGELAASVGQEVRISFSDMPEGPRLTAVVRYVNPQATQFGTEFQGEKAQRIGKRLVALAKAEIEKAKRASRTSSCPAP